MLLVMNEHGRKDFETLGEAASRLLRRLSENAKRPGAESAPEIHDSGTGPSSTGERAGNAANGDVTRHSRPAIVTSLGGSGDGIHLAANCNRRDRNAEGDNVPVAGRCCFQRFGE